MEKRRNSSGSSGKVAVRIEDATSGGSSGNSVELEKSVDGGHGGSSSIGISGGSLSKGNTLPPAEISSNIERQESNSVPVKLERLKTDSTRHQNMLSKDAAKIFDDNISVHQKLKLLNRIATVKDDGTVEFEVPADIEPQYLGDGCRTAPIGAADRETLDTEDLQCIPPMQIVMLIVGTRGDVQPFIAIGKRLQDYGHRVRLATHSNFKEFVLTAGLEFYPLGGDPKVLAGYMVKNKGFLPSGPSEIPSQCNQLKDIMYSLLSACKDTDMDSGIPFKADAIIANPPAYGHTHVAEALKVPIHVFFTMPWTPTSEFPHPLSRVKQTTGYRLSYQIIDSLIWLGIRDMINDVRKKLKLRPVTYLSGSQGSDSDVPYGYIWSPHLVPKPKDWGPKIDVVGFCFLDLASNYEPPEALVKWLEAGDNPIYIGFGSLPVQEPQKMTQIILEALEKTGQRGIINKGWGGLGDLAEPMDFIYLLDNCPHDWLFLQCKAVVHHGGAGTTAAGLKAACPTTIVPFFVDQPFWGERVHARGVGPAPIAVDQFSLPKLVDAINFMLDPKVKERAVELAKDMENEDGVTGAVRAFFKHLPCRKDDGTVEFEVPADVEPQYLGDRCRTAPTGAAGRETLDTEDLQYIPPMQIVMLIVGTRGDVQPFIAIGKRLQDYGHRVRLATHSNFKEFVLTAGFEFYPLGGDPKVLAGYMVKNKGFLPSGPSEIPIQRNQLKDIIYSLLSACKDPDMDSGIPFKADAIIANPRAYGHTHVAEALKVPIHVFFTMPWTPTSEFPHPLSRVKQTTGYRDMINDVRKKKLKLRPVTYLSGSQGSDSDVPYGYIWSPHLVPKPKDWGPKIDVVGFCFLDLASNYEPPEALVKWLEAGDKPIYIGFGSLPVQEPQKMTQIILEALEKTGQRGIINKGWGGLGDLAEPKDSIYLLDNCPHDWLFLQCKAVVHHGGAGTTAAGLKAACPTTIVPFFEDQPFWGERVHARGVGPAPIAVDQFSLPKLVDAINFMLDPRVKERAVELAKDMENEDGVTGAVKAFFKHLPCRKPDPEPEAVPSGFLSVSRRFGCS